MSGCVSGQNHVGPISTAIPLRPQTTESTRPPRRPRASNNTKSRPWSCKAFAKARPHTPPPMIAVSSIGLPSHSIAWKGPCKNRGKTRAKPFWTYQRPFEDGPRRLHARTREFRLISWRGYRTGRIMTDESTILAANAAFYAAFSMGDGEAMARLWADDDAISC